MAKVNQESEMASSSNPIDVRAIERVDGSVRYSSSLVRTS